jgi:hypothetical protein
MVVRKKKTRVKPRLSSRPKLITLYEMEIAISKLYGIRQHIIVPNLSWGFLSHEADLFIIKRSGFGAEVEIKRSLQDMKADKNKSHNHIDKQNRINEFYYAFPIELLEKCRPYVPDGAGIITCHKSSNNSYRTYARFYRDAVKIKNSRKLTIEEQLAIARLGCLRIMPLKEKLVKLQNKL